MLTSSSITVSDPTASLLQWCGGVDVGTSGTKVFRFPKQRCNYWQLQRKLFSGFGGG